MRILGQCPIYIYNCYYSQRSLKGLLLANCCTIVKKMHHFQSGFRKYDSTETALLKVQNDILLSMDRQEVCFLVLLDLSSAFDTIDHKTIIDALGSVVRKWVSANPGLKLNLLFQFMYFCTSVYFKTSEK